MTLPSLGSKLRLAREKLGYTLEQAGEELNIKRDDLKALEEEEFSTLPDKQFAITILDIYSSFLGLDPVEIREEFNRAWSSDGVIKEFIKKTFSQDHSVSEPAPKKRSPAIVGALLVLVLLGAVVYSGLNTDPGHEAESAVSHEQARNENNVVEDGEEPQTIAEENIPEENTPAATQTSSEQAAEPVSIVEVEITTPRGECWLEVVADGERVYYDLVAEDSEPLKFSGKKKIEVLFGNAGAADVKFNGKDIGTPGPMGAVITQTFPPEV